ncbi:hypothetical protein PR202_ga03403 [Eleusine coracana subsp. coracana]|uniref:Cell morphogenesis central region domain-containing protein n=1 Tax=Eleusine coracana subsp. coracana TaxID=191504 RepID=A0AAV5BM87_ELECO|nr:hypothetical protein PR202_ga03403 [Eleusine coracana subsp. coracana]
MPLSSCRQSMAELYKGAAQDDREGAGGWFQALVVVGLCHRKLRSAIAVQNPRSRREDLRTHVANIHRMIAEKVWPGMLSRKPVLRLHFLKFIEETYRQINMSMGDSFQDLQPLRYALASVLRYLAPEFVDAKSERFDNRLHTPIADGYFSVLAEVYMRQEIPKCEIQRVVSLILYKVVDQTKSIRDSALQMLETLSLREWAEDDTDGVGHYRASVVGNLPDSYQQFQYKLSSKLAKDHPELSEHLCEEIMQRPT